jgi:hypothetical protein
MARERRDWNGLVQSIRGNRAGRATFYKPVCVIGAIDLANMGRLDSDLLHSELIIRRFGEYVSVAFPDRAGAGWQPLWFLANDGLWTFSKKGQRLTRQHIRDAPSTKNKALARFDTQSIASDYQELWKDRIHRKSLRDQMLLILARDPENRQLLRALFDAEAFDDPEKWPTEGELDLRLQALTDQLDLFHVTDSGVSDLRSLPQKALLAFDTARLPQASAVGPIFEETGRTPIQLTAAPRENVSLARPDFQAALALKCEHLETLAAATNRAAHILPALRGLINALTTTPSQSASYLVWSHGNTLRRLQDAELRALESDDPESPPLPDRLGELLGDIVEQFNVYTLTDPIAGLLDRAKSGPEKRAKSLHSLQAGTELVEAVRQVPEIVDPEAARVLETATTAAQSAQNAPGFNADQAIVNAVEIQRNGARAILVNAIKELRNFLSKARRLVKPAAEGAAKQIGVEVAKQLPIASFVVVTQNLLVAVWKGVSGSEHVQNVVALIRNFISYLRS